MSAQYKLGPLALFHNRRAPQCSNYMLILTWAATSMICAP